MSAPKLNVTVVPALVLKPGDKVLLSIGRDDALDEWRNVLDQLRAEFPDVEFVLLAGAEQIAVEPSEQHDDLTTIGGEQVQRFDEAR